MSVFCLGSINADHVYQVPHLPKPGETLAASRVETGLGGKGANQSVAAARAGALVHHIGAVGADGDWARAALGAYGVCTKFTATVTAPTGHAIINVDPGAENAIVILSGANITQDEATILAALNTGGPGDFLMLQNETSHQKFAAKYARERGMTVVYSAAPFDLKALADVLPYISVLALNEGEAAQFSAATDTDIAKTDVEKILVTRGKEGATLYENGAAIRCPAFDVVPVDTTGAGDTFAGVFIAELDQKRQVPEALRRASAAAAIQVTRHGAAPAIPGADEIDAFLRGHPG